MSRLVTVACIAAAIAGCDNGSSTPGPVGTGDPPPSDPPPFVAEQFDCTTDGPTKTTDVDALPGGVWSGMLVDCSTGTEKWVHALVAEDGRFRIFSEDQQHTMDLLRGVLRMDGDTFVTESAIYFNADDLTCTTCFASSMFAAGFIRDRDWLEGRWGTDGGGYGYFFMEYQRYTYEVPEPASLPVGEWIVWINAEIGPEVKWTFDTDGSLAGSDRSGCSYVGEWTVSDSRFNLFHLDVEISGCMLDGYYSGLAAWLPGPFDDRLFASLDDEQQSSLQLLFLSQ